MHPEWNYFRHFPDGEIYAIYAIDGKKPLECVGPLEPSDATAENLASGAFRGAGQAEDASWAFEEMDHDNWDKVDPATLPATNG